MEHRWNQRKLHSLRVALYKNTKPVEVCGTHDIGMGGMFIVCQSHSLCKYDCVEIEFSLVLGGEQVNFRAQAMVIHVSLQGVGLMFKRIEPRLYSALLQLFGRKIGLKSDRNAVLWHAEPMTVASL